MLNPNSRDRGLVDNIRYRSLRTMDGCLSAVGWRDEKALVRGAPRGGITWCRRPHRHLSRLSFADRPVDARTSPPEGHALSEQRLDENETGDATISLIDGERPPEWVKASDRTMSPNGWASLPMRRASCMGCVRRRADAGRHYPADIVARSCRRRGVRGTVAKGRRAAAPRPLVRDYGMFDRREAPQFYPDAGVRRQSTRDRGPKALVRARYCASRLVRARPMPIRLVVVGRNRTRCGSFPRRNSSMMRLTSRQPRRRQPQRDHLPMPIMTYQLRLRCRRAKSFVKTLPVELRLKFAQGRDWSWLQEYAEHHGIVGVGAAFSAGARQSAPWPRS